MKNPVRFAGIAAIATWGLGWAAGVDLTASLAKIPALPQTGAAAATAFPVEHWNQMPPSPAFVGQMQQELGAASQLLESQAAASQTTGDTKQTAEDMAGKMMDMDDDERMAYLLQMKQKMLASAGRDQITPAQNQALGELQGEKEAAAADLKRLTELRNARFQFLSAWSQQDSKLSDQQEDAEDLDHGGGTAFVCNEEDRAKRLAAYAAHQKLMAEQLVKGAALEQEQRAYITASMARYNHVLELSALVEGTSKVGIAVGAQSATFGNASKAVVELAQFYDQAGRRAAHWQLLADHMQALPVGACKSG